MWVNPSIWYSDNHAAATTNHVCFGRLNKAKMPLLCPNPGGGISGLTRLC